MSAQVGCVQCRLPDRMNTIVHVTASLISCRIADMQKATVIHISHVWSSGHLTVPVRNHYVAYCVLVFQLDTDNTVRHFDRSGYRTIFCIRSWYIKLHCCFLSRYTPNKATYCLINVYFNVLKHESMSRSSI